MDAVLHALTRDAAKLRPSAQGDGRLARGGPGRDIGVRRGESVHAGLHSAPGFRCH